MYESDWLVLSISLPIPLFVHLFPFLRPPPSHPTMSEYWVSHKKYLCKYCNIYIADDAPSRRQHETGLKHKGNVERFVRGLYKAGEKRKQDLDEEKREIARIEKVRPCLSSCISPSIFHLQLSLLVRCSSVSTIRGTFIPSLFPCLSLFSFFVTLSCIFERIY